MHELSMAQGILNVVIENSENNNATSVEKVVIQIGKLALLNPEQVQFMLGVLKEDTIAENAEFVIEEVPVEIKCSECDYEGVVLTDDLDHYAPMVTCPNCETYKVEVLNGKDVTVRDLVIEKPDD